MARRVKRDKLAAQTACRSRAARGTRQAHDLPVTGDIIRLDSGTAFIGPAAVAPRSGSKRQRGRPRIEYRNLSNAGSRAQRETGQIARAMQIQRRIPRSTHYARAVGAKRITAARYREGSGVEHGFLIERADDATEALGRLRGVAGDRDPFDCDRCRIVGFADPSDNATGKARGGLSRDIDSWTGVIAASRNGKRARTRAAFAVIGTAHGTRDAAVFGIIASGKLAGEGTVADERHVIIRKTQMPERRTSATVSIIVLLGEGHAIGTSADFVVAGKGFRIAKVGPTDKAARCEATGGADICRAGESSKRISRAGILRERKVHGFADQAAGGSGSFYSEVTQVERFGERNRGPGSGTRVGGVLPRQADESSRASRFGFNGNAFGKQEIAVRRKRYRRPRFGFADEETRVTRTGLDDAAVICILETSNVFNRKRSVGNRICEKSNIVRSGNIQSLTGVRKRIGGGYRQISGRRANKRRSQSGGVLRNRFRRTGGRRIGDLNRCGKRDAAA